MNKKIRERLGTFSVSMEMIEEEPEAVRLMMSEFIVVRAEMLYHDLAIEYTAYSPAFDIREASQDPPRYTLEYNRHADGSLSMKPIRM